MTDKQIIIDGLDVSECEHSFKQFDNWVGKDVVLCDCTLGYRCEPKENHCKFYMYYLEQQLKRKEQECEELQSNVNHLVVARNKLKEFLKQSFTKNEKYKQALESIEEYFKSKDKRKTSLFNISVIEQEILDIINKG